MKLHVCIKQRKTEEHLKQLCKVLWYWYLEPEWIHPEVFILFVVIADDIWIVPSLTKIMNKFTDIALLFYDMYFKKLLPSNWYFVKKN
jgi:hypothetical protein